MSTYSSELPLPAHYDAARVGEVWKVQYETLAAEARLWADLHHIEPEHKDRIRVALIAVDVQNTFCIPGFELYVGGRSGQGAVQDNRRLVEFVYRNLHNISQISITLDTHQAIQVFHSIYLVNSRGEHPSPLTQITVEMIARGDWSFNSDIAPSLGISAQYGQEQLLYYVQQLHVQGKYDLTIWPYHAMLGSMGHALVPAFEQAVFFHTLARYSQPEILVKGDDPLTESYSAVGPEVLTDSYGELIGHRRQTLFQKVLHYDVVIIAGQAKSHCVAWTVEDLLHDFHRKNPDLAHKIYLLEDCSSPVVAPGVVDFTEAADAAYQRFAAAGMHIVRSTDPFWDWPGIAPLYSD